jgi:hypothetical protein
LRTFFSILFTGPQFNHNRAAIGKRGAPADLGWRDMWDLGGLRSGRGLAWGGRWWPGRTSRDGTRQWWRRAAPVHVRAHTNSFIMLPKFYIALYDQSSCERPTHVHHTMSLLLHSSHAWYSCISSCKKTFMHFKSQKKTFMHFINKFGFISQLLPPSTKEYNSHISRSNGINFD